MVNTNSSFPQEELKSFKDISFKLGSNSHLVQAAGGDPDFEAKTPKLLELLYSNVNKYGGSISAEHGIGQVKRNQLAQIKAPAIINTMKAIKGALDPKNLMNPGKVI